MGCALHGRGDSRRTVGYAVWDGSLAEVQIRCSEYRGSTVPFSSCLNLTRSQFAIGQATAPAPIGQAAPFQPRFGPQPVVQMQNYQPARAGKKPARAGKKPVQIMRNPARAPPTNGHMQYGNAAKGMRPPAPAETDPVAHQDKLRSMLLGQQRLLAAQQALRSALPHQHVAHSPVKSQVVLPSLAKSPPRRTEGLNVIGGEVNGVNGHDQGGVTRGGRGRGRGSHPGRARGKGLAKSEVSA